MASLGWLDVHPLRRLQGIRDEGFLSDVEYCRKVNAIICPHLAPCPVSSPRTTRPTAPFAKRRVQLSASQDWAVLRRKAAHTISGNDPQWAVRAARAAVTSDAAKPSSTTTSALVQRLRSHCAAVDTLVKERSEEDTMGPFSEHARAMAHDVPTLVNALRHIRPQATDRISDASGRDWHRVQGVLVEKLPTLVSDYLRVARDLVENPMSFLPQSQWPRVCQRVQSSLSLAEQFMERLITQRESQRLPSAASVATAASIDPDVLCQGLSKSVLGLKMLSDVMARYAKAPNQPPILTDALLEKACRTAVAPIAKMLRLLEKDVAEPLFRNTQQLVSVAKAVVGGTDNVRSYFTLAKAILGGLVDALVQYCSDGPSFELVSTPQPKRRGSRRNRQASLVRPRKASASPYKSPRAAAPKAALPCPSSDTVVSFLQQSSPQMAVLWGRLTVQQQSELAGGIIAAASNMGANHMAQIHNDDDDDDDDDDSGAASSADDEQAWSRDLLKSLEEDFLRSLDAVRTAFRSSGKPLTLAWTPALRLSPLVTTGSSRQQAALSMNQLLRPMASALFSILTECKYAVTAGSSLQPSMLHASQLWRHLKALIVHARQAHGQDDVGGNDGAHDSLESIWSRCVLTISERDPPVACADQNSIRAGLGSVHEIVMLSLKERAYEESHLVRALGVQLLYFVHSILTMLDVAITVRELHVRVEQGLLSGVDEEISAVAQLVDENTWKGLQSLTNLIQEQTDVDVWDDTLGPNNISFTADTNGKRTVRAASLNALVIAITSENLVTGKDVTCFVTTSRSFTQPATVLRKLKQRFQVPSHVPQAKRVSIKMRVINALKQWAATNWDDIGDDVIAQVMDFVRVTVAQDPDIPQLCAVVLTEIQRKDNLRKAKIRTMLAGPSIDLNMPDGGPGNTPVELLLQLPSMELAHQCTLVDWHLFSRIQPSELLNQAWNKAGLAYRAPHVLAMVERANSMSYWIPSLILFCDSPTQRAYVLQKMIKLANCFHELNNFSSLMAVIAGLSQSSIRRLKRSWCLVPPEVMQTYETLQALMSPVSSFKAYRAAIAACRNARIPYLGVTLQDLTFVEEGNPSTLEGATGTRLVNFERLQLLHGVIADVMRSQGAGAYEFPVMEPHQSLIRALPCLPEKELYNLSLCREPRTA